MSWVHSIQENLVSLLRARQQDEYPDSQEQADQAEQALQDWLNKHPPLEDNQITWDILHEKPKELNIFKKEFFGWETARDIVQRGFRNLKANLTKIRERKNDENKETGQTS